MFTHRQIWQGIDALAARKGLSPSGLAKRAGLDATSFNKSKRVTADGRMRWPTTESVSKVLTATQTPLDEFVSLVTGGSGSPGTPNIPLIGLAQAGQGGFFDDAGFPVGGGWDEIAPPHVDDPNAYALEITGDSMEPIYREGDVVIVSPNSPPRRGDRVVVKTRGGEVLAKVLLRQTARNVELESFNPAHPPISVPIEEIDWIARIVWSSQ